LIKTGKTDLLIPLQKRGSVVLVTLHIQLIVRTFSLPMEASSARIVMILMKRLSSQGTRVFFPVEIAASNVITPTVAETKL
jgi:hypothetical protein